MHFPIDIGIGALTINLHLVFETLAFVIGFRYFLYLRKRSGDTYTDSKRISILIAGAAGAFLGSRLLAALESPTTFITSEYPLLYLFGNKTIVGALLGGLLCIELAKKKMKITYSSGDLMTYPLILAMFIGRIGCFSAGIHEETYGRATTFFTGMDLGDGIIRHPLVLYEMAYLVVFALLLRVIEKRYTFKDGYRFQLFLISYLVFRLWAEALKDKYDYIFGLGAIQLACCLGLLYYFPTIIAIFRKPETVLVHNEHQKLHLL